MRFLAIFLLITCQLTAQETFKVYFDFNIDVPNAKSESALEKWIAENPGAEVFKISGHADSVDRNDYNRKLSFRRVMSVVGKLQQGKIAIKEDVELEGMGEEFPVSKNPAENRRVDIHYRQIELKPTPAPEPAEPEKPVRRELIGVRDWGQNGMAPEVQEKFVNAKPGDVIRIHNIHFFLNSEKMIPESSPVLSDLFRIMTAYPEMVIEIHGHMCCNPNVNDTALSYRRAKFIFDYLRKGGIALNRLGYKGFGTARPIHKVPEKNGQEELDNRRVEILIKEPLKKIPGR
jgi:outer membrane protein OmpA-like peptidoglycan-associated protein